MSAARYSGTGAQAASANSAHSPAANACTNFIASSEMAGRRRITMLRRTSPGPTVRSRALCREYDGGGFVPRRRQDFCGQWSNGAGRWKVAVDRCAAMVGCADAARTSREAVLGMIPTRVISDSAVRFRIHPSKWPCRTYVAAKREGAGLDGSAQAEPVYWKHTGRTAAHGNEDIELVHDAQARGSDLP